MSDHTIRTELTTHVDGNDGCLLERRLDPTPDMMDLIFVWQNSGFPVMVRESCSTGMDMDVRTYQLPACWVMHTRWC